APRARCPWGSDRISRASLPCAHGTRTDTHSFVHFIPRLHDRLDLPDVVALRAPKPLFVQQCRRDGLFPLAGMEESLAKIAKIYAKNGSPNAFTGRFYDQPHIFNVAMQDDAIAWFDQHLK
ncbi:MAG TPA: hypothetical protein DCY80_21670, partial [Solibacterales bacterium]|nr:hypothetical protein [Bryobacterales bacterium]